MGLDFLGLHSLFGTVTMNGILVVYERCGDLCDPGSTGHEK